jgi:hypothetical protein
MGATPGQQEMTAAPTTTLWGQSEMIKNIFALVAATFLGVSAVLTVGCGDSTGPAAPPSTPVGVIEITVLTESASVDVDPDGYTLSIDDGPSQGVGVNATVTISALSTGKHLVRLDGLAPNCSVSGANPRSVDVIADQRTSPVSFSVSCVATTGKGNWDY